MLILASKSPRRKELLKKIIASFVVIDADVDERSVRCNQSSLPLEISKLKAYEIHSKYPDDDVLACDTIVIYKDQVLGKPKDKEEAFKMLKLLSGNKHIVLSGYTYMSKNKEVNRSVKTIVYFNELSDELIKEYIEKMRPFDKAGAYGIQDEGFDLVKGIDGSFYNVMGLPIEDIKTHCL